MREELLGDDLDGNDLDGNELDGRELMSPGETEIDTGQDFPLNPQIKGAIRSLPGVMEVQEV